MIVQEDTIEPDEAARKVLNGEKTYIQVSGAGTAWARKFLLEILKEGYDDVTKQEPSECVKAEFERALRSPDESQKIHITTANFLGVFTEIRVSNLF